MDGYTDDVESVIRKPDEVLRDGDARWFPIHLNVEQWQAVRDINEFPDTVSPDVVDQFVARRLRRRY